uniref:CHY-type domain-containing protein n=1 Tax=Trepomonas sp. PC1 TaxID=1076344 RepID=A0A146K7B1_9EUKA|eukprot:JAP92288.1 hypothetical protein TPC1_15823 [Trepomonas sp. PC1]
MCKHIPNVQTQVYARCCKKWFDCAQCHAETEDHPIQKDEDVIMVCKKCKKVFKVNIREFDPEADGYCPQCDNHWYIEAEDPNANKQMAVQVELAKGVDEIDAMIDERDHNKMDRRQRILEERFLKGEDGLDIFNLDESDD